MTALEALRLFTGLTHDVRAPLNTLRNCLHLMRNRPDRLGRYFEIVDSQMDVLQRRVDAMLAMISSAGTREWDYPVHLASLRDGISRRIEALRAAHQAPHIDCTLRIEDIGYVHGSQDYLMRIIENLVANALLAQRQYPYGSIIVTVTQAPSLDHALLVVEDIGPGFPHELLTLPLDQPKQSHHDGTGLGLMSAHTLTTYLGGHIKITNRPHGGACVLVLLPLTKTIPPRYRVEAAA